MENRGIIINDAAIRSFLKQEGSGRNQLFPFCVQAVTKNCLTGTLSGQAIGQSAIVSSYSMIKPPKL